MSKTLVGLLIIPILLSFAAIFFQNQESQTTSIVSWQSWKETFKMDFSNEINIYRQLIFNKNYKTILNHNAKQDKTYEMGINQFAHLLPSQFEQMYTHKKFVENHERNINLQTISVDMKLTPSNDVDWQKQGKVSPVKNQGQCDAGYAFCSVSLAESISLMKSSPIILSQQQIIDCSASYSTFGCQSGSREGTLKFLKERGVLTQAKYPYVGIKQNCKSNASDFQLIETITTANGCDQLKTQLQISPLTVAVNTENWQLYRSGIFQNCGSQVNHDVFLVGYTSDYWRLKNSWGVRWGQYGYIRLRIGNTCGICLMPGFGVKL